MSEGDNIIHICILHDFGGPYTTAAVLQYVELFSLLVIPSVSEHANEAVLMWAWDETVLTSVRLANKKRPGQVPCAWYKTYGLSEIMIKCN